MQVHNALNQLPAFKKAVITIGTFDGVHNGHKQVLHALTSTAQSLGGESVLITFDPHPRKIVSSAILGIRLLNTLEEKKQLLEKEGIDHLVVVPFTEKFSKTGFFFSKSGEITAISISLSSFSLPFA